MPTKTKSPYASSFTTGVKNGTPCSTVVCNIAKKCNKPVSTIWNSLCKAGVCSRTKFNGTWVYWPNFNFKKCSVTKCNAMQTTMWQCFMDYCMASGWCTSTKMNKNCSSQKSFMTFCRTFFNKQYKWSTKSTNKSKKRTSKMRKPTTNKHTPSWARSYKFPTFKTRASTTSRRYRRAA